MTACSDMHACGYVHNTHTSQAILPFLLARAVPPGAFNLYGALYLYVNSPKTWQQAQEHCSSLGMSLPTFYSSQHFLYMLSVLEASHINAGSNPDFWIGANDIDSEGSLVWADGSAGNLDSGSWMGPRGWNPWASDEPSRNDEEDCVAAAIYSGWKDDSCDSLKPFICATPGSDHHNALCMAVAN